MSHTVSSGRMDGKAQRDVGGIVCAILFLAIGAVCFYETTQMTDPDSYVFPRMVIAGLMGLSLVLIVTSISSPGPVDADGTCATAQPSSTQPSSTRRVLLVVTLLGAALLMPVLGFLLSGFIAFIALMLLAQYDAWSKRKLLLYVIVSAVIVGGFYGIFSYVLNVPLPEGILINFQ